MSANRSSSSISNILLISRPKSPTQICHPLNIHYPDIHHHADICHQLDIHTPDICYMNVRHPQDIFHPSDIQLMTAIRHLPDIRHTHLSFRCETISVGYIRLQLDICHDHSVHVTDIRQISGGYPPSRLRGFRRQMVDILR